MIVYDIAVVGAGPAGSMAALRSAQLKKSVLLIERNGSIGKKLLLTGNGRCNVTNAASPQVCIHSFGIQGRFLKHSFYAFTPERLMVFFKREGLNCVIEGEGRAFPATHRASSVVAVLRKSLIKAKVNIVYGARVVGLSRRENLFHLPVERGHPHGLHAERVIIATGGVSYKNTGSTGDGFAIARALGHRVVDVKPALVPLMVKESWIRQLQGLSLQDVCLAMQCGSKRIVSPRGEVLFTHFGVSGPLVLDMSSTVVSLLADSKEIIMSIDLIPGINHEELKGRLLRACTLGGKRQIQSILKNFLTQRMVWVLLQLLDIDEKRQAHQIMRKERLRIADLLKNLPLTVTGALPIDRAMVTNGGIATEEINPKTMESRLVPGLYFAGEIIDGCGRSGGFNLQQAFSTGYLAGENASA